MFSFAQCGGALTTRTVVDGQQTVPVITVPAGQRPFTCGVPALPSGHVVATLLQQRLPCKVYPAGHRPLTGGPIGSPPSGQPEGDGVFAEIPSEC